MIRILVDSASDSHCAHSVFDDFVPLTVTVDGVDYKDGLDLTADRFYQLLTASESFPKTSQPSPEEYLQLFQKAQESGDEVLVLTLSGGLSGTVNAARLAKEIGAGLTIPMHYRGHGFGFDVLQPVEDFLAHFDSVCRLDRNVLNLPCACSCEVAVLSCPVQE